MIATLMAQGIETTDTEPYYATQYSFTDDNAFYEQLLDIGPDPALHLTAANPFVPRQATIPDRSQRDDVVRAKLLDEEDLALYHVQDFEFLRPKAPCTTKLRFPTELKNLTECLKRQGLSRSMMEPVHNMVYLCVRQRIPGHAFRHILAN